MKFLLFTWSFLCNRTTTKEKRLPSLSPCPPQLVNSPFGLYKSKAAFSAQKKTQSSQIITCLHEGLGWFGFILFFQILNIYSFLGYLLHHFITINQWHYHFVPSRDIWLNLKWESFLHSAVEAYTFLKSWWGSGLSILGISLTFKILLLFVLFCFCFIYHFTLWKRRK